MLNVLLIDDDTLERALISSALNSRLGKNFNIDHEFECSERLYNLAKNKYNFILLDNNLQEGVLATESVPFVKSIFPNTAIIIISNMVQVPYLEDKSILGVNGIIDKANLSEFLFSYVKIISQNA